MVREFGACGLVVALSALLVLVVQARMLAFTFRRERAERGLLQLPGQSAE